MLTTGSDNVSRLVLLFWIVTELVTALGSGPGAKLMKEGMTMTAGCTLATTITWITGVLVQLVLRWIWP